MNENKMLLTIVLLVAVVGLFTSGVADSITGNYVRPNIRDVKRESPRLFSTVENTPQNCFDSRDNDRDGLVDCADSDCLGVRSDTALAYAKVPAVCGVEQSHYPETCADAWDNDGDLLVDCHDPKCADVPGC